MALYKCDMCPFSSLENIAFARHLRNVHSKPLINAAGSRKTRISQDTEPERPDVVVSSQDLFSCPDCGKFKVKIHFAASNRIICLYHYFLRISGTCTVLKPNHLIKI